MQNQRSVIIYCIILVLKKNFDVYFKPELQKYVDGTRAIAIINLIIFECNFGLFLRIFGLFFGLFLRIFENFLRFF